MGLPEEGAGLHHDDIISIIQGHVPDGYQVNFIANTRRRSSDSSSLPHFKINLLCTPQFSPSQPMTPETAGYVEAPTLSEKIHCVVYVMDASTVPNVPADLKKKLEETRQTVTSLGWSSFLSTF